MKFADYFKHLIFVFILAITIFVLAAGLILLETYFERMGMPRWFLITMEYIGISLFVIDGILLIGTSIIFTIKTLREYWEYK